MSEFAKKIFKDHIDESYIDFSIKCTNTKKEVLGVRSPEFNKVKKDIAKNYPMDVLNEIDFETFEETNLYFCLLPYYYKKEEILDRAISKLELADSWATTDTLASVSKFVAKDLDRYYPYILRMLGDENQWVIRYGLVLILDYYCNYSKIDDLIRISLNINRDEYYIVMAKAWMYSVIYVKNKEAIINYLKDGSISGDLKKKTIRKCLDSFRISDEDKKYLKSLWN